MNLQTSYYQARYILKTGLDLTKCLLSQNTISRDIFFQKLGFLNKSYNVHNVEEKSIWIDALSVGEVYRIHSFTRKLKEAFPQKKIFLSSANKDALDLARQNKCIDHVFVTPLELNGAVTRIIQRINPEVLIVIDIAVFPFLLKQAKNKNVKTVLVGAHLWENFWATVHMKRSMAWKFYNYFDLIGCALERDRKNFIKIGASPDTIRITGSLQYDIDFLTVDKTEKQILRQQLLLNEDDIVIVAGCIRRGEEEVLIKGYLQAKKTIPLLRLILAPRYLEDVHYIEKKALELNVATVRRSEFGNCHQFDGVIIVDTFGELGKLYSLAYVAFIGASLSADFTRLTHHNVIEPLVQCAPIFWGPYFSSSTPEQDRSDKWNFILDDFKKIWKGLEIHDEEDFSRSLVYLWDHPEIIQKIRGKCLEILEINKGNVMKNFNLVKEVLC